MKRITVIGATGMIGIPVTRELINAGFEVTALVRDLDKASKLFPGNIKLIQGDLNDKASLAKALDNAEGLYINISTRAEDKEHRFNPEMQGLDAILNEAKKAASLKQVAYLSSFLARNYEGDWWVFKAKKSSINRVKASGIPYTIFYPSNFMENFANGMVQKNKLMLPTLSIQNSAWWIAGEDFGKMVAKAFQIESALNREYPVQGPEPLTMIQASESYVQAYTKHKLQISKMSLGTMKLLALVIPPLRFVSKLMEIMLNNKESFESKKTWEELGKPSITMELFAKNQR